MEKGKIRLIILLSIFAVCTIALTIIIWPYVEKLKDAEYRENISAWIGTLGFKGAAFLFGIQVLQLFIAVIPGGPIQLMAGMAYGAWKGFAIIMAGVVFTSTLIFFLVRRFGLPLLQRFFGENDLNKWSFLKESNKVTRVIFILYLIPGLPKDLLTWLAPLTNISLPAFVITASIARIPAILTSTITGDSLMEGNWILSISLFIIIAATGLLGMWLKDKIINKVK